MTSRPLFNKRDIWLFAGVFAAALIGAVITAWTGAGPGKAFARISVDGTAVMTADLSHDGEFALPGHPAVRFTVQNGKIAFSDSDCPDKTCIRSGFLSRPGQITACLPNRVSLAVIGAEEPGAIDAVAG